MITAIFCILMLQNIKLTAGGNLRKPKIAARSGKGR